MDRLAQNSVRRGFSIAALFTFVVAIIFHVDQMFLMAAMLFLLPWASRLIGRLLQGRVACERRMPALCGAGEAVPVMLTVTNVGRLPLAALRASDRLPRRLRARGERAPLLLHLRPGETREVSYLLEPERRGLYTVGPAQIETTDPLGFHRFVQAAGGTSELAVHPTPLLLRRVFWNAASGGGSQDAARVRGIGTEFHGVREFQEGDELRHVHWRTTARTGTLSVAEYTQGASRDAVIALDLSRAAYRDTGEGAESAQEYAVTLAASLCDFLLRHGHAVRLLTPGDVSDPRPPAAGPAQVTRILASLVEAEADAAASLAATLARCRLRLAPGTVLVCITPDAGDPALAPALEDGAARGALPFVVALDAPSFRRTASPPRALPGDWRVVRRGDDLQRVLEGDTW